MNAIQPTTQEELAFVRYMRIVKIAIFTVLVFLAGLAIGQARSTAPTPLEQAALKFVAADPAQFHTWLRDPSNRPVISRIGTWDTGLTVVPGGSEWELCRLAGACNDEKPVGRVPRG